MLLDFEVELGVSLHNVVPASLDLGYSSYAKKQFSFINSVDEVNEEKH